MIFLISVVLSLVCFFLSLGRVLELKTAEGWFFQRLKLCIWTKRGHEVGTLSIRVHHSVTVHDNSWALKFDNFSEFQSIITDSHSRSSVIMTLCIQKLICDSLLTRMQYCSYWTPNIALCDIKRYCNYQLPTTFVQGSPHY